MSLIGLIRTRLRQTARSLVKAWDTGRSPREIKSRCKFRPDQSVPGRKEQTRRRRKQFPWNIPPNEWRPEDRTTSNTRREYISIVTFIFVPSPLFRWFSIVFPSDSATKPVRRFACSSRLIDRRSFTSERSTTFLLKKRSSRYSSIPSPSARFEYRATRFFAIV